MSEQSRSQRPPLAIVGISTLYPGSVEAGGFWRDILAGRDLIEEIPPHYWLVDDFYDPDPMTPDKTYCKRGAFLSKIDFDPMEFGIPPANMSSTDTCQLLALIVAKRVLADAARGQFQQVDRERISVIMGVAAGLELVGEMAGRMQRPAWVKSLREHGLPEDDVQAICDRITSHSVPWKESTFPGLLGNVITGRIANRFDLGGTNCTTDAACASSFSALSMAANELYLGDSDMVITGGVDTTNDPFLFMCFSKTPALSFSGDCRPFSDKADGTMLGEGLGMVALRRLEDAERDGNQIYAVLRGVGTSSDGRAKSVYAPLPAGQSRALRDAYAHAGYGPDTVELLEAHGTGTMAGDIAEFQGMTPVFDETGREDRQWCALGSIKSQLGHTKSAAGVAGLVKVAMALRHKVLPPTIKVDNPDPKLEIERSPFHLNTRARPWISDGRHPRRGAVSSFGFGGTNFHITLEEYQGPGKLADARRTAPAELFLASAPSAADLAARCEALAGDLGQTDEGERLFVFLCREGQERFEIDDPARLAIVAADHADLEQKLAQAAERISARPAASFALPSGVHFAVGAAAPGEVAFLFSGQGSQYMGMGADLAMTFDRARRVWDRAAGLEMEPGLRLHEVMFPRPVFSEEDEQAQVSRLTATQWAQPAIGAASLAILQILRQVGLRPASVGGHSFGEVTALCAAGVLSEEDLLRVARRRGELMNEAAAVDGTMTAVVHPLEDLRALLDAWELPVVIANINSPRQVVLSGTTEAIEQVEPRLKAEGIQFRRLPVATAFHSPVVDHAAKPFGDFLGQVAWGEPDLQVFSNSEAAPYPDDPAAQRELLARQIARPVLFAGQIEAMYAAGARVFVEVGPGRVLTNLVGQCLGERPHLAVSTDRKGQHGVTALWRALGNLAVSGVKLDLSPLWSDRRAVADPRLDKKPVMTIPIDGVNHGKLYPPAGGADALPPPNPPRPPAGNLDPSPHEVQPPSAPAPTGQSSTSAPKSTAPTPGAPTPNSLQDSSTMRNSYRPAKNPEPWLQAYQEIQRQTAEAHDTYQKAMADSHLAFLRTAEASSLHLYAAMTGDPLPDQTPLTIPAPPQVVAPAPELAPTPAVNLPAAAAAAPELVAVQSPEARREDAPPHRAATEPPATVATAEVIDFKELLLATVAEKTGYPQEILTMEMDLEADLGIDSIKRVEILSALQEQTPELPEVDASDIPTMQTLGQVLEFLEHLESGANGNGAAAATPAAAPEVGGVTTEVIDFKELLLATVAEKTGYPQEILTMEMDLEADLGIDSIKRVEILSALQEQTPELPEVDASEIPTMQTLGQVLEFLEHLESGGNGNGNGNGKGAARVEMETPPAVTIERQAVVEIPAPAGGDSAEGGLLRDLPKDAAIAVIDDHTGVAEELCGRLDARGLTAIVSEEVPPRAAAVVFLGGLDRLEDEEEALAINHRVFQAAKEVAARFSSAGGVFVTVQDTGGDFGLSGSAGPRAWLAGLAALVKTAALEWTDARVRAIDLERGERTPGALARAIEDELFCCCGELEVGLHADGRRTTLGSEVQKMSPGEPALAEGAVLVASGGARGVTAATLLELARQYRPRVALLGRTVLEDEPRACRSATDDAGIKRALLEQARDKGEEITPAELGLASRRILANREIRQTLEMLSDAGSEARYLAVDVQDAAAVEAALTGVREEWGPVSALVHGAGVLADKRIADKSQEQFDRVFDTKVRGLQALLRATADDPLRLICLFSSVAARFGNIGQCDYAMANEVINRVAALESRRRGDACLVRTIGWGPWAGGMVTPALKVFFEGRGVPLIPLDLGARMLADEVRSGGAVEVIIGGTPQGSRGGGPAHERPVQSLAINP